MDRRRFVPTTEQLGRTAMAAVVVLAVLAASGVGMYFFFTMSGQNTVEEVLTAGELDNATWGGTLHPGETAYSTFEFSNRQAWDGEHYAVRVELTEFDDLRENGTDAARSGSPDGYISKLEMQDVYGEYHSFRSDLLNDGVATYHYLDGDGTVAGNLSVTLEEAAMASGDLNVSVRFGRVNEELESQVVQTHSYTTGQCSQCHEDSLAADVHLANGLRKDQTECASCHGLSTQDIHQTCTGCHDEFPVVSASGKVHGFAQDEGYEAILPPTGTCGNGPGNCHRHGQTIAHRGATDTFGYGWVDPVGLPRFCGQCHNKTTARYSVPELNLTEFHGTSVIGDDCRSCHGVSPAAIHEKLHVGIPETDTVECADCHRDM